MSKLKDAIEIKYDDTPLSPWGKRVTASVRVFAETIVNVEHARGEFLNVAAEDLKRRVLRHVYCDIIPEMHELRCHIMDLRMAAGPGAGSAVQKAMETWGRMMDTMVE